MDLLASFVGHVWPLEVPREDCTDRVIIITGANTGLGLEAARHFVRLNASRVILACRNLDKAENAKRDIEQSTKRTGVVEAWHLDLSAFESVRAFARQAERLQRLDIVIHNASIFNPKWETFEGHESQVTVNVISMSLLSLLLLPTLRMTSRQHNVVPRICIVSSDSANLTMARELKTEHIMRSLDDEKKPYNLQERYGATKLMQLMVVQKLAGAVDESDKGHVLVNGLNPGTCRTELFRNVHGIPGAVIWLLLLVYGRTAEMGSRTLMAAAFAREYTHGGWMTNGRQYSMPRLMRGDKGQKLTDQFWDELMEVLEEIEPGITQNI